MNTKQAAKYLGISYYYLRNLRHDMHEHSGPEYTTEPHAKGTQAVYTQEALDAWKATHPFRRKGGKRGTTRHKRLDKFAGKGDNYYV